MSFLRLPTLDQDACGSNPAQGEQNLLLFIVTIKLTNMRYTKIVLIAATCFPYVREPSDQALAHLNLLIIKA